MIKDKQKIDNYAWRCTSNYPFHDIKINIRDNSQFDVYIFKYSNDVFFIILLLYWKKILMLEICKKIRIMCITKQSIVKFFEHISNVIKEKMNNNWLIKLLGENGILYDKVYNFCEIDESEIIGNQNVIYWIFCVLNNRTKENLLHIVKNDIITD